MKTILVSLNNESYNETVLAVATKLAQKFDSHIVGLHVMPTVLNYDPRIDVEEMFEDLYKGLNSKAENTRKYFEDHCAREVVKGEWRLVKSPDHLIDPSLIDQARCADLTILGCPEPDSKTKNYIHSTANVVQGAGRPVLVVPNGSSKRVNFDSVIVGWNGSKESSRAVYDALPFMSMANKTVIHCVNAKKTIGDNLDSSVSDLVSSLSRHDIEVYVETVKTRKNAGITILDRCGPNDLLVVGAYGHSRLRENILGGVTATVLEKTTCPILLSN